MARSNYNSRCTVPNPPSGLNLESNVMEIPNFNDFQSLLDWRFSENREIIVNWNQESEDDWFYVVLKNLESNPTPININTNFSERMRELFSRLFKIIHIE